MSKLLLLVCIILVSISCIYAQQSNCPYGTIPGTMVVGNNNQRVRVVRIAADQLASSTQADNMIAKSMACAWWKLFTAAKSSGHDLKITSGFRTLQRQQELYNRYRQGNGPLAARPGTSNHGSGNAIDINARGAASQWLQANAARYGFSRTIPAEPWHYVYGSVQGKNEMELDESELDEADLDESELELDEANIQEEESIDESESELDEAKSDNNSIEQGPAWNALPTAEKIRRLQVRHDAVKAEWDRLRVRTARTLPESQKLSSASRTMNLLSRRLVFYRQQQSREAMLNRNRNRTNEGEFDDAEVDDAEVDEEVANVDEAQVDEVPQVKPNHATPRPIHRMAKNIKVEVDVNAK